MKAAGCEKLVYRVGSRALVEDVTLDVYSGEILAIVGPNGAGKSTLLRLLAGELSAHVGETRLGGTNIAEISIRELARLRAVLPQNSALQMDFLAMEVVLMGRAPWSATTRGKQQWEIAGEAMSRAGVAQLAQRRYTTLSGGERQRVHLARCLAQMWEVKDAVLLLDEPSSAQDIGHQHRVMHIARDEARRGCAVVAVLHDLSLAAQYANRVALMDRGKLLACGVPAEVLTSERLTEVYDLALSVDWRDGHFALHVV